MTFFFSKRQNNDEFLFGNKYKLRLMIECEGRCCRGAREKDCSRWNHFLEKETEGNGKVKSNMVIFNL